MQNPDWAKLAREIHADNKAAGWWTDLKTGVDLTATRDRLNMSMLIITELAEAADAYSRDAFDDELPQYKGVGVELADAQIRILDRFGADCWEAAYVPYEVMPDENFDRDFTVAVMHISDAAGHDRKGRIPEACSSLTNALNYIEAWGRSLGFDMHELREAKREYNRHRPDYKPENRRAEAESVAAREAVWSWYTSVARSALCSIRCGDCDRL